LKLLRRQFLARGLASAAALTGLGSLSSFVPLGLRRAQAEADSNAKALPELLEASPYVYLSPLRSDGEESQCHAEVWYAWLDGAVVMIVAKDRWKAKAIERGLVRARIWVGDHGRWKGLLSNNEDFRQAPSFAARGERVRDKQVLEQLLARYEDKYPAEIASWRDKMRGGYADGSRVLLRYRPEQPL